MRTAWSLVVLLVVLGPAAQAQDDELPEPLAELVDDAIASIESGKTTRAVAAIAKVGAAKLPVLARRRVAEDFLDAADELLAMDADRSAIELYRALSSSFRNTEPAVRAAFALGEVLLDRLHDPTQALVVFTRLLQPLSPKAPLAAQRSQLDHRRDVVQRVAHCLTAQGRKAEALATWIDAWAVWPVQEETDDADEARQVALAYLDLAGRPLRSEPEDWTPKQLASVLRVERALRVTHRRVDPKKRFLEIRPKEMLEWVGTPDAIRIAKQHFSGATRRVVAPTAWSPHRMRRGKQRERHRTRERARISAIRARAGRPQAMLELSQALAEGWVVLQDPEQAERLLIRAAKAGSHEAMVQLAGRTHDVDDQVAWAAQAVLKGGRGAGYLWRALAQRRGLRGINASLVEPLEKLAAKGDLSATWCLALMFKTGRAGSVDLARTRRLLLTLARTGAFEAQFQLARMLEEGQGGPKDLPGALTWYRIAMLSHHDRAKNELERVLRAQPKLARQERQRAQGAAAFPLASHYLGWLLEHGLGGPRSEERAVESYWRALRGTAWFPPGRPLWRLLTKRPQFADAAVGMIRKAAQAKNPAARHLLAGLLRRGIHGVERDPGRSVALHLLVAREGGVEPCRSLRDLLRDEDQEALTHRTLIRVQKKAAAGDAFDLALLGWMFEHGLGVLPNETEARQAYQRAVQAGCSWASLRLAILDQADEAASLAHIRKAALSGDPIGMRELGVRLLPDQQEAGVIWLGRAARKGDALASLQLGNWQVARPSVKGGLVAIRQAAKAGNWEAGIRLRILLQQYPKLRLADDP